MNEFVFLFERAKRVRSDFLSYSNGKLPHYPLSAEDIVALCDMAKRAGFSANTTTVKILGEFCCMGKSNKRQKHLAKHFATLMDDQLVTSYLKERDISSATSAIRSDNVFITIAEYIVAKLAPFLRFGHAPKLN